MLACILYGCSDESIEVSEGNVEIEAPDGSYVLSQKLFRTYGVGYGYDAMGSYANTNEVKDRILSLPDIIEYENKHHISIFVDDVNPYIRTSTVAGTDCNEYATSLTARACLDVGYLLFEQHLENTFTNASVRSNTHALATVFYQYAVGSRHIDPHQLSSLIEENPQLLSRPFLEKVEELSSLINGGASSMEIYFACKDFIKLYGTHLIYHSDLGGSLEFNIVVDKDVLTTTKTIDKVAKSVFGTVVMNSKHTTETTIYQEVKNRCSYTISARGGDVDILREFIGAPSASGKYDENIIARWIQSISFDMNWTDNGNSEMADFKLFPIVDLIADERVKEYLTFTIKSLSDEYWDNYRENNNVIYQSISIQDVLKNAEDGVVKILRHAGKDIAEICNEHILYNGSYKKLATIYPIVNGVIKTTGFAMGTNELYTISWSNSECSLKEMGGINDNKLYYTNGVFTLSSSPSVTYTTDCTFEKLSFFSWDTYYSSVYKVGPYLLLIGPKVSPQTQYTDIGYDIIMADKPYGLNIVSKEFAQNKLAPLVKEYELLRDFSKMDMKRFYGFGEDDKLHILEFSSNNLNIIELPDKWDKEYELIYYRPNDYRY